MGGDHKNKSTRPNLTLLLVGFNASLSLRLNECFSSLKLNFHIAKLHSDAVLSVGNVFLFQCFFPRELHLHTSPPKIPLCAVLSPSSGPDQHYHCHHESCCSPDDVTLQLLDSSDLHLSSQEEQSDGTAHSTSLFRHRVTTVDPASTLNLSFSLVQKYRIEFLAPETNSF